MTVQFYISLVLTEPDRVGDAKRGNKHLLLSLDFLFLLSADPQIIEPAKLIMTD